MKKHWMSKLTIGAVATGALAAGVLAAGALALGVLGGAEAAAEESAQESVQQKLAPLGWMSGQWRGAIGSATWEASYTSADGGVMLSANKQYVNGRVNVFEFEHFAERDGKVVLTLFRGGNKGPWYEMTSHDVTKRLAVFVNEAEDFPREIRYHRAKDAQLLIDVLGQKGEQKIALQLDLELQK